MTAKIIIVEKRLKSIKSKRKQLEKERKYGTKKKGKKKEEQGKEEEKSGKKENGVEMKLKTKIIKKGKREELVRSDIEEVENNEKEEENK